METDLFGRFAHSGVQQSCVTLSALSTRQRHVAGPGIAGPLGATDEEDAVGTRNQNYGDGGPEERRVIVDARRMSRQSLREASDPGAYRRCHMLPQVRREPGERGVTDLAKMRRVALPRMGGAKGVAGAIDQ